MASFLKMRQSALCFQKKIWHGASGNFGTLCYSLNEVHCIFMRYILLLAFFLYNRLVTILRCYIRTFTCLDRSFPSSSEGHLGGGVSVHKCAEGKIFNDPDPPNCNTNSFLVSEQIK